MPYVVDIDLIISKHLLVSGTQSISLHMWIEMHNLSCIHKELLKVSIHFVWSLPSTRLCVVVVSMRSLIYILLIRTFRSTFYRICLCYYLISILWS